MSGSINLSSQRISFVTKISTLQKALSDDESPTPVYMYNEINEISFESVGYCESLVEFLVDRLKHKSCHVKLKVLKLMKHLLDHGSKEFKLGLRQQVAVVKECTKFSGPPHPIHGNTPYALVRNISMDLCEKLYNLNPLVLSGGKEEEERQSHQSKYGGMGPYRTGGAIQGFGNTPVSQPKGFAGTILQEIEKLGSRLSETSSDRQAAVLARLNLSASSSNYQPPVVSPDASEVVGTPDVEEDASAQSHQKVIEKPVSRHLPGKAGGGWNDDDNDDSDNDNLVDSGKVRLSVDDLEESTKEGECQESMSLQRENQDIQHSYEMKNEENKLVTDTLTADLSPVDGRSCSAWFLSNSCITEFLSKCSSLRASAILDSISLQLDNDEPLVAARSLQLLEGIAFSDTELINVNVMASKTKNALAECFHRAGRAVMEVGCDGEEDEEEGSQLSLWKAVMLKAAKLILILQQLSSHKEIVSNAAIASALSSSSPVSSPLTPTTHTDQTCLCPD